MIASFHPDPVGRLPLDNDRLAGQLEEVADRLDDREDNPFRARAYRNAAQTVRQLDRPVAEILETEGTEGLIALPGIGKALARALESLTHTGEFPLLNRLRGETDAEGLLATVPGVGPALAHRIVDQLHIWTLEDLEAAAHDGRLQAVPGLGPKRLRGIRESLAGRLGRRRSTAGRAEGAPPVEELLEVDRVYREEAAAGRLKRLAPRRFNPTGEAWLPMLRLRRGRRRYRALYSNTALAHQLEKTRDWVVIYCDDDGRRDQWTVVTAASGPLAGLRVVRGRERECERYYAGLAPPGESGSVAPGASPASPTAG